MKLPIIFVLILSLLASGCASSGDVATQPPAPQTLPASLTLQQVLNTAYTLHGSDGSLKPFTLTNGAYVSGNDPAAPDALSIGIIREAVAFGDINGDGAGDAVVPIFINYGGTGAFVHLAAVLNRDGQAVHSTPATYGMGDRAAVQSLKIANNRIDLAALVSAPNDPLCCPSVNAKMTFEYSDMGFRVLHVTTSTPSGLAREISITAPADESNVQPQITLTGTTTVGPFENNLIYRVYDANGMAVVESGFMVQNEELGAPSTFSLPLDFAQLGISGRIRVEISEMSMADGSTLMMDSVYLNVGE